MKYFLLSVLLTACSADPMCHPQVAADYLVAVPAVPLCAIHVAENQCGPQGCGSGGNVGFVGPTYTVLGPGNDLSFVFTN